MKTTLIAITGIALILNFSCKNEHKCKGVYDGTYMYIDPYARAQWVSGVEIIEITGDLLVHKETNIVFDRVHADVYDCEQRHGAVSFYERDSTLTVLMFESADTFKYMGYEFTKIQ